MSKQYKTKLDAPDFEFACRESARNAVEAGVVERDDTDDYVNDKLSEILAQGFNQHDLDMIDLDYTRQVDALHYVLAELGNKYA